MNPKDEKTPLMNDDMTDVEVAKIVLTKLEELEGEPCEDDSHIVLLSKDGVMHEVAKAVSFGDGDVRDDAAASDPPLEDIPQREMTDDELASFALRMLVTPADSISVFDVFSAALTAEAVDPILQAIRGRDRVRQLLQQLADATLLLTGIAEKLSVTYQGQEVKPDPDFNTWDSKHIGRLTAYIRAEVSRLQSQNQSLLNMQRQMERQRDSDRGSIDRLATHMAKMQAQEVKSTEEAQERAREISSKLCAHKDVMLLVVAKIDSVTGNVESLYYIVENIDDKGISVKATRSFAKATKFDDYRKAHDLRVALVKNKRKQLRRKARGDQNSPANIQLRRLQNDGVAGEFRVMQVSLHAVTASDFEEGSE